MNATSLGGEVDALDPAGYGPIFINQAITIEGQGWSYIAPPASGNGITINAVSGSVVIHGVLLNGAGIAGITRGILFNSGAELDVAGCTISNFSQSGIYVGPLNSASFTVSNTTISNVPAQSGGAGIYVVSLSNTAIKLTLDHVSLDNNFYGVSLNTTGNNSFTEGSISNSVIANSFYGFYASGLANSSNIEVLKSVIFNTTTGGNGITLAGYSSVYLSQVTEQPFDNNQVNGTNDLAFSDGTNLLGFVTGTFGTWGLR